MKKMFFILTTFLVLNQAHALTSQEYSSQFIAQVNQRLKEINQERKTVGKTPYCVKLSKSQENLIRTTAAQENISAGEFADLVSKKLKCYPEVWGPWGRENIGGLVFNTKAFIMDTYLVRETMETLRGRSLIDAEVLFEDFADGDVF